MRKLYILTLAALAALATACAPDKDIPSEDMVNIITETLLANGIMGSSTKYSVMGAEGDTVDYYGPILARYGYDIGDFRHTVYEMSTRKSNPLNEIFAEVTRGIDSLSVVAEYRYKSAMRYDTLVLKAFADTLYLKDTTIRGSLKKFKIAINNPLRGDYRILLDYKSLSDYRYGSKALAYRTGTKNVRKIPANTFLWLNRAVDTTAFDNKFSLNKNHDSLIITFNEPVLTKDLLRGYKDTSFIKNIRVIYTPSLEKARAKYFRRYFKDIKLYQIIQYEEDSLHIPFARDTVSTGKWGRHVR